jgi:hypothetical protein
MKSLVKEFQQICPSPYETKIPDFLKEKKIILSFLNSLQNALPAEYASSSGPLEWWFAIGAKDFPYLTPLARVFLAMPATSAPSEAVFSRAGFDDKKNRSRLGAQTLRGSVLIVRNVPAVITREDLVAECVKTIAQSINQE